MSILLLHAAATLSMTGLIWFVQVVHYPLMARVGGVGFSKYEAAHTRRTTWVVAPLMLIEGVTAVVLLFRHPPGIPPWQIGAGLALLVLIWVSTALLQVPQHRRLSRGFDSSAHARLVSTNWIRTVGWSSRSVLVLAWLG